MKKLLHLVPKLRLGTFLMDAEISVARSQLDGGNKMKKLLHLVPKLRLGTFLMDAEISIVRSQRDVGNEIILLNGVWE